MKRFFVVPGLAILGLAPLSACVTAGGPTAVPSETCGAQTMQSFVGQPERALSGATFNGPVRILHPNDAVTMDYSGARLNFAIDDRGIITRVYCG